MTNIEDLQKEELINLEVEEVSLEDLIILGNDKLINISITYPEEKDETIRMVKTKAKIKQLTMKQIKNLNVNSTNLENIMIILKKALYTQEEKAFTEDLILELPIGVCIAIAKEIMRISGVEKDLLGF